MKKKIFNFILLVFGFFFFSCFKVNAAENVTLNFDINEHFNYYYEFLHNTSFYQFVIGKGSNFGNYLKSYNNQLGDVFFAYSSDVSVDTSGNHYAPTNIPDDSFYVIILRNYKLKNYLFRFPLNYSYSLTKAYCLF